MWVYFVYLMATIGTLVVLFLLYMFVFHVALWFQAQDDEVTLNDQKLLQRSRERVRSREMDRREVGK